MFTSRRIICITGLSFRDQHGNKPVQHTFTFNMKFDLQNEEVNDESIKLLKDNGTDFDKLKESGCDSIEVVDELKALFKDRTITWVTFHG